MRATNGAEPRASAATGMTVAGAKPAPTSTWRPRPAARRPSPTRRGRGPSEVAGRPAPRRRTPGPRDAFRAAGRVGAAWSRVRFGAAAVPVPPAWSRRQHLQPSRRDGGQTDEHVGRFVVLARQHLGDGGEPGGLLAQPGVEPAVLDTGRLQRPEDPQRPGDRPTSRERAVLGPVDTVATTGLRRGVVNPRRGGS